MRKKQIKNKNQLPAEFSLDKYSSTINFDIVDWVENLELRVLSLYMENCCDGGYAHEMPRRSLCILEKPIFRRSTREEFEKNPGLSKHIEISSVKDFTVRDFYWQNRGDHRYLKYMEEFDEHINRAYGVECTPDQIDRQNELELRLDVPYFKMMKECGISHNGDLIANIDLHATDEKIIADFTKWLSAARDQLKLITPRKKFSKNEFSVWSKNCILPYLDLTAWARANDVEITQQLLGTSLFPDEYDVNLAERVRKVIAPMAKNIARDIFTDALRSQAISDLAEGKTVNFIPPQAWSFSLPDHSES